MASSQQRTIFRNKALQYYAQSRNMDVLPRFVAPPVFLFLWILLGLLMIATLLAWLGQVPSDVAGSGVVLNQGIEMPQGRNEAVAVIFLPATSSLHVRAGLPVQVQIGTTGPQLNSIIDSVQPGVISPSEARQHYGLNDTLAITQPSFAVTVRLGTGISTQMYAGSSVSARVQMGTRSVLSLLPVIGHLIGD